MGIPQPNEMTTEEDKNFWISQLHKMSGATSFPQLPSFDYKSGSRHSLSNTFTLPSSSSISSTIFQTAWGLLSAQYADSSEIVFAQAVGKSNVVPVYLHIDWESSTAQVLENVQQNAAEAQSFDQFGLDNIQRLDGGSELNLHSLLIIVENDQCHDVEACREAFPLILTCVLGDQNIDINAQYDETVIDTRQMTRLLAQLEHLVQQLRVSNPNTRVRDLRMCSEKDHREILSLHNNRRQHLPVEECLHLHFEKQAALQPGAEAICSWDRNFTYHELDIASARLARQLSSQYEVQPEIIIPVCFSKSSYAIVSMLAILRAGGAYTAIDPNHPPNRIQEILSKTTAKTVVTAPEHAHLFDGVVGQVVLVSESHLASLPEEEISIPSPAKPNNAAIILFTSGSTGKPKGIVLEHKQLCKSFTEHGRATGFRQGLRVLQLAAYTFDVSNSEIMQTLFYGGVVCVPSDDERMNDLTGVAARLEVEWSWMTPSLAGLLNPAEIPTLQTLGLGGEVVPKEVVAQWVDHVRLLYITYGPAECAIYTSTSNYHADVDVASIGMAHGCLLWIVDPQDHDILVPFGCVGELIIEGPIVGREYLDDPELTRKAFIQNPRWVREGECERRFYKTGDLVQYDSNGAIQFVGRKDTQVKLRGQRIEMGDIEHHLQIALPESKRVLATIIKPHALGCMPNLAAFIHIESSVFDAFDDHNGIAVHLLPTKEWQDKIQGVREYLSQSLPPYMVPPIFIPMLRMPTNASWKTDRRRLHDLGAALTVKQLALLGGSRADKYREPSTNVEKKLQTLWATVLSVDSSVISADDSFFRIGGNSIQAMRLVGLAREQGLTLTVKEIFTLPRLSDLAQNLEMTEKNMHEFESESIVPFALLKEGIDADAARQQAAVIANLDPSQIEDIFPCTPLQEGLLAMTAKRSGDYVSRSIFRLSPSVDVGRLKKACEMVVEMSPILRTRVVDLPGQGLVQVIVNELLQWSPGEDLEYEEEHAATTMGLGTALSSFRLVQSMKHSATYLVWTIHHALYDGWSIPLILDAIERAYQDKIPVATSVPFQHFVKHILEQDGTLTKQFWQNEFADYNATVFPPLPSTSHVPLAESMMEHRITRLTWPKTDVTPATAVRTAWAILQACYTGSHDVVFGATMAGRQAAVPGVELMAAPTIATVPVRVMLDGQLSVEEVQQKVQRQVVEMIPYEQTGLQYIRRISEEACQFQTLLVVQPVSRTQQESVLFEQKADGIAVNGFINEVKTYSLMLDCQLEDNGVHLSILFDPAVIEDTKVDRMVVQLEHILRQICAETHRTTKICDIETSSEQDLRDIWNWNASVPQNIDACIHDLISATAMKQPSAPAVCSWDGDLTYTKLDEMSTRLAHRLVGLGVGPDVIVPLCFEKSMWTPVAQLAVMKAGGASVMCDMSLPVDRLQSIVQQVRHHPVILASAANKDKASRLSSAGVMVVNAQSMAVLKHQECAGEVTTMLPCVPSSSLLYLVFTSGSTGTPKGVRITHSNLASALHHQRGLMGFDPSARVFDFAAYAFDISWSNFLHTLTCGGCLCIPSDEDRKNDLAGSINKLKATTANLTPTASRLINPRLVPTLKSLILAGEKDEKEDFERWGTAVDLKHIYGPAECTPVSTGLLTNQDPDSVAVIGRGLGANSWVVDVESDRLVPPGVTGELWLEGPIVGAGYLNDKQKTAKAFIHNPSWLVKGGPGFPGRHGRLYKTGDLVRYRQDGTLVFVGRKDTQVKIRGQRVELGDIEHHIQHVLANQQHEAKVVAEIISIKNKSNPVLIAFVSPMLATSTGADLRTTVVAMTAGLDEQLATFLPAYMIPSAYIPIKSIPTTATGKTDRRRLREVGASLTMEQLATLSTARSSGAYREPTTIAEKQLQELWASVLGIYAVTISADDSFLRIGGDSIQAMRLVSAAREKGISLTVANVLQHPRLSDMSQRIVIVQKESSSTPSVYHDPEPYTLINAVGDELRQLLNETIAPVLDFPVEKVQDVFPTTDIQASCADAAMHTPPQGCFFFHIDIPAEISMDKLTTICHQLWDHLEVLRTVFAMHGGKFLQIVPHDIPTPLELYNLTEDQELEDFSKGIFDGNLQLPLRLGAIFTKFILFHRAGHPTRLAFRVSHAHFDGVSLVTILKCLAAGLQGQEMPPVAHFAGYIRHVKEQEEKTLSHWRKFLKGSAPMSLTPTGEKCRIISMTKIIASPQTGVGCTHANLFFAGCAQTLSQIRDTTDVVMSMVVSARTELPAGLDDVVGPCLNIIPLRVKLDDRRTFTNTLGAMQQAQLNAMTAELSTIENIYKTCAGDWPEHLRKLTYTIQFQNVGLPSIDLLGNGVQTGMGWFGPMGVWEHSEDIFIIARPVEDNWHIAISGNANHCTKEDLDMILEKLGSVLLTA